MNTVADTLEKPQRADARRNHERILECAREVFSAEGVDAQMDEVAQRAGVGVGTLYRHFPTKEALLLELLRERVLVFIDNTRNVLESDEPAGEAFRAVLVTNAEVVAGDTVCQQVLVGMGEQLWAKLGDERNQLDALTAELIERAQRAGAVRSDLTPSDVGMMMCGLCTSMTRDAPGFDWRRHLALLLDGVGPQRPQSPASSPA
jgi:AcrR family transcriptional regulator